MASGTKTESCTLSFTGSSTTPAPVSVADTIAAKGLPLRQFVLPRLDEAALGALLQHFLLETILAGDLMGVSPFAFKMIVGAVILVAITLSGSGVGNLLAGAMGRDKRRAVAT